MASVTLQYTVPTTTWHTIVSDQSELVSVFGCSDSTYWYGAMCYINDVYANDFSYTTKIARCLKTDDPTSSGNWSVITIRNGYYDLKNFYYRDGYIYFTWYESSGQDEIVMDRYTWGGSLTNIHRHDTGGDYAYNVVYDGTGSYMEYSDDIYYVSGISSNWTTSDLIKASSNIKQLGYNNITGNVIVSRTYTSYEYNSSGTQIDTWISGAQSQNVNTGYCMRGHRSSYTSGNLYIYSINVPTPTTDLYVTPTGAGAKNGYDWDNAMDTVNEAMVSATNGNTVHIAFGTYTDEPANNTLSPDADDVTVIYETADTGGGSGTATIEVN